MSEQKNYYAPMHTAEHILNAAMVKLFGCLRSDNCHIERKKSRCDFKLEKQPSEKEIRELEKTITEIINQELPVSETILSFEEAEKSFNLKRIKKNEHSNVRIISIGDFDYCPCIGAHVKNTSELKNFKITTSSFENGIFRVRFKV